MVPQELRGRTQWLVWRYEKNPKKPEGKHLKVPYYANGEIRKGKQGSDTDRAKLTTFEHALAQKSKLGFEGVGFAFLPQDGLIGIDLDGMIDNDGVIADRAQKIIAACASYTEFSPSKKGMHIFVLGQVPASFKSNEIGVEVFCGGQYFTFTGDHYPGTPEAVNAIDAKVIRRLQATVDAAKGKRREARAQAFTGPEDKRAKVESALAFVNPDLGYNDWIAVGMAIYAELGESGFSSWDGWSAKGGKYAGQTDMLSHWKSFGASGKTFGEAPLYRFAIDAGWRPPRRQRGESGTAPPPPPAGEPPPEEPGPEIPLIKWVQGRLPDIVDQAEAALISSVRFFQRGSQLVRIVRRDKPTNRDYDQPLGVLALHGVDKSWLIESMTRAALWKKYDSRAAAWVRMNAPELAANTYLARAGQWKVPALWSVITAPTLRSDGTVLQEPGYDEAKQCWYDPCGVVFPRVPDAPTKDDAKYALERLLEAFGTLPFDGPVDRSVMLALVLGALVRRSLPSAPLGGITAPDAGTGKTLIADAVSILATGAPAAAMKYPETDEEAAKMALAILAEGEQVILIDNVERPLQGDWLCTILTSEHYQARVLGRTEMMTVPTTSQWLATGNNLVLAGDLRTRSLLCRMDAKCERPDQRTFAQDLRVQLMHSRPELVAAGLTVIRAFLHSGVRAADIVPAWGRFERWSAWVRAPLVWLGHADPCDSRAAIEGNDPTRDSLVRMHAAWLALFGEEPKTTRQVVEEVGSGGFGLTTEQRAMREVLLDVAKDRKTGEPDTMRLGHWLRKHLGRRVLGRHFERPGERDHVAVYRLVKDPNFKEASTG